MRWNTQRKLVKRVQATVRELRIPPLDRTDLLGDLVAVFEQRLGYSITVVTTENDNIIKGALESRPGGGTAIVVPAGTSTPNRRRHLVCRGLARCVYREPGHRTGRIDYSTTTEQEIEYTALFLGRHVENAQQQHQPRSAAT
ncbi:hypothetical protein P8A22_35250 [Streptomyces laculatispora]|uniref:Uncharacterized protein n=1 Tax=Streptomyces laculatispora TaxID=887464 RepID=A0ABY9IE92_9ACTN|nr:hypothetical protein [Streptomyces laculatispora]WLQ44696.1 hypothetical protein P8A22_35250 [Streptomyces laculatispora]